MADKQTKAAAGKGGKEVTKKIKKAPRHTGAPVRLWAKAVFTGFRRSKVNQNSNQALLKIQGVNDAGSSMFYWGKRAAYVYKAHSTKNNTKFRAIWGRIARAHGDNGIVIARFKSNLPPRALGATVRVFLYPHRFSFNSNALAAHGHHH